MVPSHLIRTKADEKAIADGCYFDPDAGKRVAEFFHRFLRHSKGKWAGKPFELLDWQRDEVISPLFGWRREDGTRRFRRAYVEIPKKNGKSTLASGLGLYFLVGDGEGGPEVFSAAVSRDQAMIVHGEAMQMVKASEPLQAYLRLNKHTHTIHFEKMRGFYRAIAADAETAEGKNTHACILDELHAWSHGREFYESLRYGGAARAQPMIFQITTAGIFDPNSICWEEHKYAEGILEGHISDITVFPYIRAAGKDDDWGSEETWKKANPSYGVTIRADEMRESFEEARVKPGKENTFKRYRLNLWTQAADRWISSDHWAACADPNCLAGLEGEPCVGALDLSSTRDLTAFVLLFPRPDGSFVVLPHLFAPEECVADRSQKDNVPYQLWADQGAMTLTPGNVTDYTFVEQAVVDASKRYDLREVAYDKWGAADLVLRLKDNHGIPVVAFGQTIANFAEPTKRFADLIASRKLLHPSNPVMDWCAGNVVVSADASGNIRPVKNRSREKIDPIVAAIMALGRLISSSDVMGGGSVYETRGLLEV